MNLLKKDWTHNQVLSKFPDVFVKFRDPIEGELKRLLRKRRLPLYEMMRYHLGWVDELGKPTSSGGKYLRATLCLLASQAVGGEFEVALRFAAAIELVHNFSLIHDDIQDRDNERRHRPTVWKIWGEPQAINAGTAMRMLASIAITDLKTTRLPAERLIEAHKILDESCLRMIEGQYLDISFEENLEIQLTDYMDMVEKKTAALIEASLQLGAITVLSQDEAVPFKHFGRYLGMAFQIRDDMLGIWGEEGATGKPGGSDIRHKKKSFPIVYALERASGSIRTDIISTFKKGILDDDDIKRLMSGLEKLGAYRFSQKKCEMYYGKALNEIKKLPVLISYIDDFKEVARFLIERNF